MCVMNRLKSVHYALQLEVPSPAIQYLVFGWPEKGFRSFVCEWLETK